MEVEHVRKSTYDPSCELRVGPSSCGPGDYTAMKYTWFTANGKAARGGEFPIEALPDMIKMAIELGYLKTSAIIDAAAVIS